MDVLIEEIKIYICSYQSLLIKGFELRQVLGKFVHDCTEQRLFFLMMVLRTKNIFCNIGLLLLLLIMNEIYLHCSVQ
jgi:hypothetical protein